MKRTLNGVVVLLAAVACGEDRLVAPEQPVSDVLAESENALLADPLVSLLVGSLTDPTAADAARVALASVSGEAPATPSAVAEDVARVGSLVREMASRDTTGSETQAQAGDLVALAALGLLLERAGELRNAAPPSQGPIERSGVRRPRN